MSTTKWRVKPLVSIVGLRRTGAVRHLSLDGRTPLCGQGAYRRYFRVRGPSKANCKLCAELVRSLSRRLR